uniref:Uncharacterized protein ycf33 n=1 Tax=Paulinella longichromatophora TaxID=1708747 RepID=A0A2H4ZNI2_9EUKA|nr:hypothetical protein PLO_044 [Paulinella longichromatophora]
MILIMKEFFINVIRYPRYLIAFSLGVINSIVEPLAERANNPVTTIALISAFISGVISLGLILRAMVNTSSLTL